MTFAKVFRLIVVPSPSCPHSFVPEQPMVPSRRKMQENEYPVATPRTSSPTGMSSGVVELSVVPFPKTPYKL